MFNHRSQDNCPVDSRSIDCRSSDNRPHSSNRKTGGGPYFVLLWGLVLGIFTCTHNLDALLYHQVVHFQWTAYPNFSKLLTKDMHLLSPFWWLIKTGHFMGFAIMDLLLMQWLQKRNLAAVSSVLVAVATEILQLYLGRDGRLHDMGIDTFGIFIAQYVIARIAVRIPASTMN